MLLTILRMCKLEARHANDEEITCQCFSCFKITLICVYTGGSVPLLRANVMIDWFCSVYSHLWTCLQLDSLLLQDCIVKYSLFRRIAPLSDSDLGNVLRKREEAKNRWEEKSEWWEEDKPTSEDHRVCPPCRLPLHFLVCLSLSLFLALFTFLLISLMFFSFSLLLFLTPPSLRLCMFLALLCLSHTFSHFSVSTAVSLQLCTSSLDHSFPFFIPLEFCSYKLHCAYSHRCVYEVKVRILDDLPTLVVTGVFEWSRPWNLDGNDTWLELTNLEQLLLLEISDYDFHLLSIPSWPLPLIFV